MPAGPSHVPAPRGIVPGAVVAESAKVGERVSIGPCAVVEDDAEIGAGSRIDAGAFVGRSVKIGADSHVYPRAVIYAGTTLGNRVVVHAGAANLGLLMRTFFGKGTPRGLQGRLRKLFSATERSGRVLTTLVSLVRMFGVQLAPQPMTQVASIAA